MNKTNNSSKNLNQSILKEYLRLIKANLPSLIIINIIIILVATIYAITTRDIYTATTDIKITSPQGSILTSPLIPNAGGLGFGNDLLIANEIQTVKFNYSIREQVANAIIDSAKADSPSDFALIVNDENAARTKGKLKDFDDIVDILENHVEVEQIGNLDFISIAVESPSAKEASVIANSYAEAYRLFNLMVNRNELTTIRITLEEQRKEKLSDLISAENNMKAYQLRGGVIQLDEQAKNLIDKLSDYESQRNASQIDLSILKGSLEKYKNELKQRNPSLISYLESKTSEPYLVQLQTQIAQLETQKDIALTGSSGSKVNSEVISDYNNRIEELKDKLNKSIAKYQSMILSSSPEEIKDITQKVFETEVKYQAQMSSYNQLGQILSSYEGKFNNLPGRTLDLARLERERSVFEKLYLALEEKYQEALINEQAMPGNVFIMNYAFPPPDPNKPNRPLIIVFGVIIGFGFGFGFIYLKDFLNKKIKTPEDIEELGSTLLTWVPRTKKSTGDPALIVFNNSDFPTIESFRALRTRIQFSKSKSDAKTILITSSAPGDGKTMVSLNLASSFARDDKRTIIIDCDLRKPRLHSIMGDSVTPGISDYLFGRTTKENIVRVSKLAKLDYITAGTIQ
ncbi:MAG: GumC family protein, partial [Nitrososphaeraceae archaeon]